jgi:hypothetical protein
LAQAIASILESRDE